VQNPNEQNRRVWDERARSGASHAVAAGEKEFQNARAVLDSCGWLPKELRGKRVLCLAAGGGWHGPLFAHLGAEVTVVDISEEMLVLDRKLCEEHRLPVRLVRASMDDLSALAPESFELVIQPVSTCYVPDVAAVYREVARVTRPAALYISQHKQPASLQASARPGSEGYVIRHPYQPGEALPAERIASSEHREAGAREFIHSWESLIGGLCRSGFVVEDLLEPRHAKPGAIPGRFGHRSAFLPPYVTIKARKTGSSREAQQLWIPT